ncbi:hypothetical protein OHA40_31235 [Nocardia sp. NBC_00508]|uniref:hypothetical protein n=1 Tax=Nocardia sp. NBC_00508 TaxID=2975992 RepID=UPI002E812FB9|nr:hypothetical protein [Nocardia sp. NBC_00508]WUD66001.1 hypothetical protein OHA40_31235 [Nocardia sp. NBC_00508]
MQRIEASLVDKTVEFELIDLDGTVGDFAGGALAGFDRAVGIASPARSGFTVTELVGQRGAGAPASRWAFGRAAP